MRTAQGRAVVVLMEMDLVPQETGTGRLTQRLFFLKDTVLHGLLKTLG